MLSGRATVSGDWRAADKVKGVVVSLTCCKVVRLGHVGYCTIMYIRILFSLVLRPQLALYVS